jgi:DMSO/TMAO reductase YedYZ heme-binding membrane subunit
MTGDLKVGVPEAGSGVVVPPRGAWRRGATASGLAVLAAGVVVTGALWAWIAYQQSQGRSAAALDMSDMGMTNMAKFWAFPVLQASGLTGLLFAYLGAILGLQQSGRAASWFPLGYRQVDRLHRQLSLLVIGLVLVHVVATAFDAMGDSWKSVLLPAQWSSSWPAADWGYNTGVIALYLLLLTAPTYYLRRVISPARWRIIHRFVIVFYVLSVWHALLLGADIAYYPWLRPLIWLAQVLLLALLIRRLRQPLRSGRKLSGGRRVAVLGTRYGLQVVSAAAIVAIVLLVVSGHSGFVARV